MPDEVQQSYLRLNVWATCVSFAVAAAALAILAWPFTLLAHHRMYEMHDGGYPMMHGGAAYGKYGGGAAVGVHVGIFLAFVIWAGIAGAIVAAVYNAMVGRRP